MRRFETGATRDEDNTKIDPEGFYSPLVIEEFCRYMNKHRIQADGKARDSDNWQQLFGTPEEHRKVCMSSLIRHVLDLWKFHRGYVGRDTIKEALCAIIFNAQAYLFSILLEDNQNKPIPDHGSLAGLEDDDVPQYSLEDAGAPVCAECGGTFTTGHQGACNYGLVDITKEEREDK